MEIPFVTGPESVVLSHCRFRDRVLDPGGFNPQRWEVGELLGYVRRRTRSAGYTITHVFTSGFVRSANLAGDPEEPDTAGTLPLTNVDRKATSGSEREDLYRPSPVPHCPASTPSSKRSGGRDDAAPATDDGLALEDVLDESRRAFLADVGATVVPLTPDTDLDGAYLPHLREHGHVAAIIRPDFYLYGTATTAQDLAGLVDQLRDQLHWNQV